MITRDQLGPVLTIWVSPVTCIFLSHLAGLSDDSVPFPFCLSFPPHSSPFPSLITPARQRTPRKGKPENQAAANKSSKTVSRDDTLFSIYLNLCFVYKVHSIVLRISHHVGRTRREDRPARWLLRRGSEYVPSAPWHVTRTLPRDPHQLAEAAHGQGPESD